jgi:hypothetical protein
VNVIRIIWYFVLIYFLNIFILLTMSDSTPNNPPSLPAFLANRDLLRLNRIGCQHFQRGRFSEASECFLGAMKDLKRTCSFDGNRLNLPNDVHALDVSDTCQEESISTKTTRLGAVLQPMSLCTLYLLFHCETSDQSIEVCSSYTLISFVLIFNLATTIHHHALMFDEQCNSAMDSTVSQETLVNWALQLYQCSYKGASNFDYPSPAGLDKTVHSRQIVLGQQLVLSIVHNMGLLLSTEEQRRKSLVEETEMNPIDNNGKNSNSDCQFSSYRCFQVVFATLHSLRDYYGIRHSDFPSDFEMQLVIDTALEGLSHKNNYDKYLDALHSDTAPCA